MASDLIEDKAAEEGAPEEQPQGDDEFEGLPEDEAEASDSGSSDSSGSSSDEEVRGDGLVQAGRCNVKALPASMHIDAY